MLSEKATSSFLEYVNPLWKLAISPNPFIQRTTIMYQLPVKSRVSLKIYDVTGRLVKILVNREKKPGYYNASWDAKELASGIYFVKFEAGDYKKVKKLILMLTRRCTRVISGLPGQGRP